MRTYKIQRGANWYLFCQSADVTKTLAALKPGEIKITIAEMSAGDYFRSAPAINRAPADHLNSESSTVQLSSDR